MTENGSDETSAKRKRRKQVLSEDIQDSRMQHEGQGSRAQGDEGVRSRRTPRGKRPNALC